jgi:hypothetical protein
MFISGETNLVCSSTFVDFAASVASVASLGYCVNNDVSSPTCRLMSPIAINTDFGNIVIFIRTDRLFQVLGSFT